jgi:hypothetical protein
MENNELNHWGIKGMRWGIRRFQNKDGSLTPAGKKRREQQDGDDSEKAKAAAPKKKSVSEMTDDELNKAINRARLEDTYRSLRPEQEPAIKKFISTALNDVVAPATISAGRDFLEKAMKKIGADVLKDVEPEDPNSISALTKVRDKLKLKSEINKYKNSLEDDDVNWENRKKKLEYEKEKAKTKAAEKEAKEKTERDSKAKKEADTDSSNKAADKHDSDDTSGDSTIRAQKPTDKWWKSDDKKSGKSYTEDIIDMSTSTDLVVSSSTRSRAEDFVDALWKELE